MQRRPGGSLGRSAVAPRNDPVTPEPTDSGEFPETVNRISSINPLYSARATYPDVRSELLGHTLLQVGSPPHTQVATISYPLPLPRKCIHLFFIHQTIFVYHSLLTCASHHAFLSLVLYYFTYGHSVDHL